MLLKTSLREIRTSLGRYLAIFSIIALGVGFFAGLRVTRAAMLNTADEYLSELHMFDGRLLSTLGWTQEDVDAFAGLAGVRAAAGVYSADFLRAGESGSDTVLKAYSLTSGINDLCLQAGRLPEKADECVVDAWSFEESDIGKTVRLSENNSADTIDAFAYREYTIVGVANSPIYINYERGGTSLGNGTVSAFVYLPEDGFTLDYFTEIDVTFTDSGRIYSDEYKAAADAMEEPLQTLADERAQLRYESLRADAQSEIDDAQQKLNDAQSELESGWSDYRSAERQYQDGLAKYESGMSQYEDGQAQYESGLAQYEEALAQYEQLSASPAAGMMGPQLAQMKAQLDATAAQLEASRQTLESTRAQLEASKRTLDSTPAQLAEAKDKLTSGEQELAENRAKLDDAKAQLDELKTPDTYVLGRGTNVGYACFESDTNIVAGISRVFPLFFFLLAALVCITTMTRMVEDQRTQLGTLMALGFGNGAIIFKYFFYSGSASLLGCIVGFVGGSYIFPKILWMSYNIMYGIPVGIHFVLDWGLAAVCFASYLFCALGATYLVCRGFLREVPAELIRPKAPKAGKRILLEKITFLWKRMGFLTKVSMRNVLRYKQRFFMMVLGIGGCTALLLTGFGIKDSIANVVDYQYAEITRYDCTVSFTETMDAQKQSDFLAESPAVQSALFLYDGSVTAETASAAKTVSLLVPEGSLDGFMDLHSGAEKLTMPAAGETLLNNALAEALGVGVGDTVTLRDGDMRALTVTVAGVFDNYVSNYAIVTPETCQSQWGSVPGSKTAFVSVNDTTDDAIHAASAQMLDLANVSAVTVNIDIRDRVATMMSVLDYIVWMVTVCAGALAFIVLYNLTNININERIREIATIKVLGFYPSETASYVFRENNTLVFLGMLLGLPLGKWLHAYVISQIKVDMIAFDVRIAPMSVVYSLLLTVLFAAIVDFVMYFRLRRISMAESLKSIE